jgi:integrase
MKPLNCILGLPSTECGRFGHQLDQLSGVSGWTLHDLRRIVATRLVEMGIAPHVIERLLNHVTGTISGIAAVYNRARYLDEMRDIEKWDAKVAALVA